MHLQPRARRPKTTLHARRKPHGHGPSTMPSIRATYFKASLFEVFEGVLSPARGQSEPVPRGRSLARLSPEGSPLSPPTAEMPNQPRSTLRAVLPPQTPVLPRMLSRVRLQQYAARCSFSGARQLTRQACPCKCRTPYNSASTMRLWDELSMCHRAEATAPAPSRLSPLACRSPRRPIPRPQGSSSPCRGAGTEPWLRCRDQWRGWDGPSGGARRRGAGSCGLAHANSY